MFSGSALLTPSAETILALRPANDNTLASCDYLERMAWRSRITRAQLRRMERCLLDIKTLLLGAARRASNHPG